MAQRTPEEIRRSIEANRMGLAVSVQQLRGEVVRLTDWRGQVERHRSELQAAGAGLALLVGVKVLRGRRRRRRAR